MNPENPFEVLGYRSRELLDTTALEIQKYMESKFPVGPSLAGHRSVTGEPYIVLAIGGVKPEGECFDTWVTSIEKAKELFIALFEAYIAGKDGALYWRRLPQVHHVGFCQSNDGSNVATNFYTVSARFLVSDKKPL